MAVVLVVTSAPPLVEGGHLVIARALVQALIDAGHRASMVTTPSNRFGRQAAAYVANWCTDVGQTGDGEPVDQVISLRYPSFAVRHRRHVSWLNHTMREYYDLWEEFSGRLTPQGRLKESARRVAIRAVDTYLLKHHVTRRFAQSSTIRDRMRQFNGLDAEVLHPPAPPRAYRCDGYGDYLFFASRLQPLKRTDLILRALAEPAARHVRCVIGGDGDDLATLRRLAGELGIDGRVRFVGRLDDAALTQYLAGSRAVVFVPKDEDYGFVTVEAFASGKAVITATDSGGPLDLVRDAENGFVVRPEPAPLAAAMARLMDSPSDAARMGQRALQDNAALSWGATVARLTDGLISQ